MAEKQLIIAVEGTATMGPYWQTIVFDYLENIIRCFCGNKLHGQKPSTSSIKLSLVTFYARGSYCDSLVLRSGWTKDVDSFLQWLSAIQFGGDSFNDAAIAEGLSEAFMMFPITPNGNQFQQNVNGQRHCILVAASNPHPFSTLVYQPQMQNLEQSKNTEALTKGRLFDVETVAKLFAQYSISLSVICPRQLPKLRAIYAAGKRNPQAANPVVDKVKNPHFLVLISENFMEACATLSTPGVTSLASNQSPVKMGITYVPTVTGPPPTSILSDGQQVQSGRISMNQNLMSGLCPSGVSSGTSAMIPTPKMPQQVQYGMQSLGANNNSVANMTLSPHISSTLQSAQSKYVKVWEGNLFGQIQGQSVCITRIEGYKISSTSETITANWPQTMHITQLISHDHMNNREYVRKANFLIFRAIDQHEFLKILQKKKLDNTWLHTSVDQLAPTHRCGKFITRHVLKSCEVHMILTRDKMWLLNINGYEQRAVIKLPSQTLLLSSSDKAHSMIGMLFPGDMVEFKSQTSSQQQEQQQHQQMQSQQEQKHPPQYIQISDDESTELEMTNVTIPDEDLVSVVKSMRDEAISLRNLQIPHDNDSKKLLDFVEHFVKKFHGI